MVDKPEIGAVAEAALQLQEVCLGENWRFCFIGGLALLAWAYPRSTIDADITLLTGFGGEEAYIDLLLARFEARVPDARDFALRNRVLLLRNRRGIGLDIGLGALPFEENAIRRSVLREIVRGCALRVCTAEDLIVHKAFASRDQDWADVDAILMRGGSSLDTWQIFAELEPLVALKEEPEIVIRLKAMMSKRLVL
jgi:hypothetical protein